jgi:hypothetical protein
MNCIKVEIIIIIINYNGIKLYKKKKHNKDESKK